MKLIIQIPCLNERDQLEAALRDLPRSIAGVDEIEVMIIDDGSSDGTSEVARELGVHHIVRFARNRGLASAFSAGIDAALRLGADIIVNTDADNQYPGDRIPDLVEPVIAGRADISIGDRQTDEIEEFSGLKRLLQRKGSAWVRRVSGTNVADSPSGFRAFSRQAAMRLFVHNKFTYTLETIVQSGRYGLAIENVKIRTNAKVRESRLFSSIPNYLRRAGTVVLRAYLMYQPMRSFGYIVFALLAVGFAGIGRFLYFYILDPLYSGHTQSLVLGVGAMILAFMVATMALLADLVAANRRLLEELLMRTRRMESDRADGAAEAIEGVESTGAAAWGGDDASEA